MKRILAALFCLALIASMQLALAQGRIVAQDAAPLAIPLAVATPEGITPDEVNAVARDLWCPLCNGVRLDACELKACEQMRDLIAIKLGEGQSSQQIQEYFVDYYGPQVLGRPPFEGFNWLAWLLPALVLVGGGALLFLRMRRMVEPANASAATLETSDDDLKVRWLEDELNEHE